jgi:hypothetical protein
MKPAIKIFEETELVKHVNKCFRTCNTKLSNEVFSIEGYSGTLTRIFYNNICELKFENRKTEYLEVGVWKGSSFVSSMFENEHVHGVAVDNWSEFGGPRDTFFNTLEKFNIKNYTFVDGDFFNTTFDKKFDIYMYDGNHDELSHSKAIEHAWPYLADEAIIIVDDWNWECVRNGTYASLPMEQVVSVHEIIFDVNATGFQPDGFWNGIGVFVVKKK